MPLEERVAVSLGNIGAYVTFFGDDRRHVSIAGEMRSTHPDRFGQRFTLVAIVYDEMGRVIGTKQVPSTLNAPFDTFSLSDLAYAGQGMELSPAALPSKICVYPKARE